MTDSTYWRQKSDEYGAKYGESTDILDIEKQHRLDTALSLATVPRGGVLLDIGVGSGELFTRLPNTFEGTSIGLDFSRDMIHTSLETAPGPEYLQADAGRLPFQTASLDLVFCLGVLGHLEDGKAPRLFDELSRVVAPDGQVVFSFANARSPFRWLRSVYFDRFGDGSVAYQEFDPATIRGWCSSRGFSIGSTRYLTFSSGLLNYLPNRFMYELFDRYATDHKHLSSLAMTWVVSATKD